MNRNENTAQQLKYLRRLKKVVLIFVASFAVIFASILGIVFFLQKTEQCPPEFTQAQVDASNCIVGAPIAAYSWPLILAVGFSLAMIILHFSKKSRN